MTKEDLGHLIIASTDSLYRISKSILRNETDCEDAVSEAIVKSFDKINTLHRHPLSHLTVHGELVFR